MKEAIMEIVPSRYAYTYVLRNEDKQVRYTISYKEYFKYGSLCDIDMYIRDLLEREMKKLMNYEYNV